MDIFSTQFLSALAAIIVIDLVLAGDNAIVIALAARTLPAELQKKAIVWGTLGAIVVRVIMTLVVVWLLSVPWLRLAGGVLLIWIAFKLLAEEKDDEEGREVTDAPTGTGTSFGSAIRTIVVADAVMGLDNVLGVAGAAKGSFLLVVLGLAISIPIMIWGSTLILKWVERFPVIIYVGAGVLAWTAAAMIHHEPHLTPFFAEHRAALVLLYAGLIVGILGTGWWVKRRHALARRHGA
jgi:YjbE family integral membrane protein